MVVDYRKVIAKIVFDSYPMPNVEQAFEQFAGAVVFSVFDLNSAYFQIPLTARSRRVTAFCTAFGLFEFNRLPMGISVKTQSLTLLVDELFSDIRGNMCLTMLMTWLCTLALCKSTLHTCALYSKGCRMRDSL